MTHKPSRSINHNSLNRREFLKLAGTTSLGVLLAACGSQSPAQPTTVPAPDSTAVTQPITLRYWTFQDSKDTGNPRAVAQETILKRFMDLNPGITIQEEVVPWQQIHTQLMQAAAANTAPDVCRMFEVYLGQVAASGSLIPLDPYISSFGQDRLNDYVYSFEDTTYDGKIFALRQSIRPANMLYWRIDLLEAAGFNKAPTTLDEFTEASKATTKNGVVGWQMALAKIGSAVLQYYPFMYWSFGTDLVDFQTGKATFHNDAGQQIHQWLQDMVHVHKVMPAGVAAMDVEAISQVFLSGGQAMHFNHSAKFADWKNVDALKDKLEISPAPNFANDPNKPAPAHPSGWTLVIPKGAKEEAAWKLVDFMNSPEAELIDARIGGELPTRKSTLEDPFFASPEAGKIKEFVSYLADYSHPATTIKIEKSEILNDILSDAVQQIVSNKADVKTTLDAAAQIWDSQIAG